MASDVRALMAAERQSRRITHDLASYTKSGMLTCTICQLGIKSESLWDGHLRSANHKKNVKKIQQRHEQRQESPNLMPTTSTTTTMPMVGGGTKRKIDDADLDEAIDDDRETRAKSRDDNSNNNGETRKKLKPRETEEELEASQTLQQSRSASSNNNDTRTQPQQQPQQTNPRQTRMSTQTIQKLIQEENDENDENNDDLLQSQTIPSDSQPQQSQSIPPPSKTPNQAINEDEWAAFEKDIAPLSTNPNPNLLITNSTPNQQHHIISAAPISASELEQQANNEAESRRKLLRDAEAQDEKEDEGRRMEEEFEVMEEMEERVRKLREKREALRLNANVDVDVNGEEEGKRKGGNEDRGGGDGVGNDVLSKHYDTKDQDGISDEDDEDEVDDWYS